MKILFLSTTFPDAAAPSRGTYNAALCQALAKQHQVRVVASRLFTEVHSPLGKRRSFSIPDEIAAAGIQVDYPTYWYSPKILQHRYGDQMWWSIRSTVERAMKEFQPDAVLSYWAHPDGEVGVRAAQLAGIPSAVIVGGTDVLVLPSLPRRGERIRDVLIQSSAVISVSNGLRDAVIKLGVHPDRVQTVYQGIDPALFHTQTTRAVARKRLDLSNNFAHLVWVGRMVPIKSLSTLLEAASRLRHQGLAFQLHLIGDGPSRSEVAQQVAKLGLDSFVRFHGAQPPERTAEWYRAADLTVLSSDSEGLPNVLRESLACGTPVVTTDVGSVREIGEDDFAAFVPPRDPVAFSAAINAMLTPQARDAAASYRPRTWLDTAVETAELLESCRGIPQQSSASVRSPARRTTSEVPLHF